MTAQIKNTEEPVLSSQATECNCIVNLTTTSPSLIIEEKERGMWQSIYQISYMYYSMTGTLLTIFFGLAISKLSDMYTRIEILKITSSHDVHEGFFRSPGLLSVASFTVATGRKLSQMTLKVENKLKEVISHTAVDKIAILDEEDSDSGASSPVSHKRGSLKGKMFFIGHHEDEECEDNLLTESHSKPHCT